MTLSLRDFPGLTNPAALRDADLLKRQAHAALLRARIEALRRTLRRHRDRLPARDRREIQQVLDRGEMDLGKRVDILQATTDYVDRFHHHILRRLAV